MHLYLVRHAHAVTEEQDPSRPLSPQGRADIERVALFLNATPAFRPAQLWHSPLARARETAALLARHLAPEPILVETPGLLPEDDPRELATRLESHPLDTGIALVGHEPHLGALATLLVRGKPRPTAFNLQKTAIIALEPTGSVHKKTARPRWRIRWHLTPELLKI